MFYFILVYWTSFGCCWCSRGWVFNDCCNCGCCCSSKDIEILLLLLFNGQFLWVINKARKLSTSSLKRLACICSCSLSFAKNSTRSCRLCSHCFFLCLHFNAATYKLIWVQMISNFSITLSVSFEKVSTFFIISRIRRWWFSLVCTMRLIRRGVIFFCTTYWRCTSIDWRVFRVTIVTIWLWVGKPLVRLLLLQLSRVNLFILQAIIGRWYTTLIVTDRIITKQIICCINWLLNVCPKHDWYYK